MIRITERDGGVLISGAEYFSVKQTFDCGQCFRFDLTERGAVGYAFGKKIELTEVGEGEIFMTPCTEKEFHDVWERYLALDTDYGAIRKELTQTREADTSLATAMETGKGIRILRQEPWEALCSFIISQNNNIPRIKKTKGEKVMGVGERICPMDSRSSSTPTVRMRKETIMEDTYSILA